MNSLGLPRTGRFQRSNSGLSPFSSSNSGRFCSGESEDWRLKWKSSEVLTTTDDTDSLGGSDHSSNNSSFSLNRTVRDYGERINSLQRENFDLKLRIFLLEERLSVRRGNELRCEDDTDTQLYQCKTNLDKCIKLVEEAAQEIEYLETKIETQKTDYEERILNVETELAVCKMKTEEANPLEPSEAPLVMLEVGTDTDDLEVEETPVEEDKTSLQITRDVYYESVQSYRKMISRLEAKVRTAEAVWREVTETINKILTNRRIHADMNLAIFISSVHRNNQRLRDIFDLSDIYIDIES